MSLITQDSRISHHTVVVSGLTGTSFTVAPSLDFTDKTWTIYDLDLSEFGIDELRNKLYIRIGSNINEIPLNVTGGSSTDTYWSSGSSSTNLIRLGTGSIATGDYAVVLGKSITGSTNNTTYVNDFIIKKLASVPTSSADSIGEVGSITYDDSFFYWKTNTGWLRVAGLPF